MEQKYKHVWRSFEALRPQEMRIVRGVEDGEDLDFDRALEMMVDKKISGSFFSGYISVGKEKFEIRQCLFCWICLPPQMNLANAKGKRILDVEKESLFVISEALDALGDDFSIYGFSGYGRDQAAFISQRISRMLGMIKREIEWAICHGRWRTEMESQFDIAYKNYKHKAIAQKCLFC